MPRVFIGVGHGGPDPGAVANGLKESYVNLTMAKACKDYLEAHGVTVGISRLTDESDTLSQEIAECKAFKPDIAIEIHNNAGGGDGFECYTNQSAASIKLAGLLETQVKAIGQNSRGLKYNAGLGWTKQTGCVVLCEGFFLDSNDRFIADTAAKQQAFGVAYAKAILSYLGITDQPIAGKLGIWSEQKQRVVYVDFMEKAGNNYIKLRDFPAIVPGVSVEWSSSRKMPVVKW